MFVLFLGVFFKYSPFEEQQNFVHHEMAYQIEVYTLSYGVCHHPGCFVTMNI
jgi:hypothetical protein